MAKLIAGLLALAVLVGCRTEPARVTTNSVSAGESTPQDVNVGDSEQDAVLRDGVTTAEYSSAFQRFSVCADEVGSPLVNVSVDTATGFVGYATSEELGTQRNVSALTDCYLVHFDEVERIWQTSNPEFLARLAESDQELLQTDVIPCLEANEVSLSDDIAVGSEDYGLAVQQWMELDAAGKC